MNHTPGPWKHGEGVCNHKVYSVAQPEKDEIVRCYGDTPEEAEANARLIAAAPELLNALIAAEIHLEDIAAGKATKCSDYDMAYIKAAIAKATGG